MPVDLHERQTRGIKTPALEKRELVGARHDCIRVVGTPERKASERISAYRALLDYPRDVLVAVLFEKHQRDARRDTEAKVDDPATPEFAGGPARDDLLEAPRQSHPIVVGHEDLAGQGWVVEGLGSLQLIGHDDDDVYQDPWDAHLLRRDAPGLDAPLDL